MLAVSDQKSGVVVGVHITFTSRMSESKPNEVMDVLMAKEPTSKHYSQKFDCSNQCITHEHSVEVEIKPERTE